MSLANFFPIGDVGHEHAGADDVFQRSSGPLQSAFDVLERLNGLRIGIASDELAIQASRGRT